MTDTIKKTGYAKRTADEYADAFVAMFPTGQAWPKEDKESVFFNFVSALSKIYAEPFEGRANLLLTQETDPRLSFEMLSDWERNWGLPDPCFDPDTPRPLTLRRADLLDKITMLGAQDRGFFIARAARIGYEVEIIERAPFMCGVSRCGGHVDENGWPRWEIGPRELRYQWYMRVLNQRLTKFHVGSGQMGITRLLDISIAHDLECIIRRWKPAHTIVFFDYSEVP